MHGTCVIAKPHSRVDHRERVHTFPSQHAITSAPRCAHERGTIDPHTGRFLNTDPVIADIFDGQTLNAFSYVGNNPLTLIDPTGFAPEITPDLTIPLKPAEGYVMIEGKTGAVLKYGESTQLKKRYTQKYLDAIGAQVKGLARGTKREMHYWQHNKILEHKAANGGKRPPLNKSDW